ncbi:MAG: bacillithiol biosynthesis cysteine-adding enzyme BshC [Myxococcota bacterium]
MHVLPLPDPLRPEARATAVRAAAERSVHPDVLASIRATTPAQERSRDALARGVAVVTGQQAGLFGGPLYTVYKAAAAIVNARALEAETGVPCAPVFWLQDEDHDFDEIASVGLLDREGRLAWARVHGIPEEDGRSVVHRRLGPSVVGALAVLEDCIGGLPHAPEILALFRGSHTPDTTASDAFRAGLDRLFAPHGLLVVDAGSPDLREAAAPVHARAFADAVPLSRALQAQSDALEASGRGAPVWVRPEAPLSFVHPDGPDGPRYRVEPHPDGGFLLCGTDRVLDADTARACAHSTSALLRPVLQDTWLPTAAYVGGPGELAYLAQMPPLYAGFGLPVPLMVPRARFLVVDGTASKLLDQLGLRPRDLASPREALLARLGTARGGLPDPDALLASVTDGPTAALTAFRPQADGLDAGLGRSVDKTLEHLRSTAEKLVDRYRKALARDDEVMVDRLDRLLDRLQPDGAPQERVLAWAPFAARVGIDAFVERVLSETVPFDAALREVSL